MNLQTNGEKRMRAVCFSKDKYSLFAEKQTTITPAKITNYVMSTSLYGSEEEILINDMNVVQTPSPSEYSFQYEEDGSTNAITPIDVILTETESGSFVNTQGKLTKDSKKKSSVRTMPKC